MAQAPDFIAKLVDDISFLDAPAIAVEVFQSNDILYKVDTAQQSQLWQSLLLSMANALMESSLRPRHRPSFLQSCGMGFGDVYRAAKQDIASMPACLSSISRWQSLLLLPHRLHTCLACSHLCRE